MSSPSLLAQARQHLAVGASMFALLVNLGAPVPASAQEPAKLLARQTPTATPVKHVIVVIGENRTFDHIFATYKSKSGENVSNLLSTGIIKADGTPGPNYSESIQYSATDTGNYSNDPGGKNLYGSIPPVVTGGPEVAYGEQLLDAGVIKNAYQIEPGFLAPNYYQYLMTGGTGLTDAYTGPDTRIPNVLDLPGGSFQLTPGVPYDAYANSPVHRFYQMWQQEDCTASLAPRRAIPAAASTISFLGLKSRLEREPTVCRNRTLSPPTPPGKVPPRWSFTTCSRVTHLT
jgi:phospholipase C